MPKVIDKAIDKINHAAFNLFAEKGYHQVTMKMVAQEAGISVGTLYNYYLNKQDLFLDVFKKSLEQTHAALDDMIEKGGSSQELLTTLYHEIVRLRELSWEILKSKIDHEVVHQMREYLVELMRSLIYKVEKKEDLRIPERDEERTTRLLLLAINDFSREFPDDREGNIAFICRLVEKIK